MGRRKIGACVERRLYAESMGKCMNPDCKAELFIGDGDIIERAHIDAYCESEDNSFDNLVVLCPSCHTKFDKLHLFTIEQIREWKLIRKSEVERFFSKRFKSFDELSEVVTPLILENKSYFENYYLRQNKALWDKFECRTLINNRKLKALFVSNLHLFQTHPAKEYSNLYYVQQLIAHIDEFEATRGDDEKIRQVLFPVEINSIFGIAPTKDSFLPSTESLEMLIENFRKEGVYKNIVLGVKDPYISFANGAGLQPLFLKDTPRLRQLYHNYKCFKSVGMRFESLNFAFTYLKSKGLEWKFAKPNNLREVSIKGVNFVFVYEYCLSDAVLLSMSPNEKSVVVNLHNWNGERCISDKAYERAKEMKVTLMTMEKLYSYVNEI